MGKISLLVILLFGLTAGVASRRLAFDDDEFQHAHMAWLLARGEVPHRDFFEHHLPLYHFLLAPFTLNNPGPERILWLRGLSVLIAMATLAFTARAVRVWNGGDSPGILALTAFSPIFFVKMVEVRPEGFCLLLAAAALVCLKNPQRLLAAGLLTGAMVMGSQKFVFLALGLLYLAWREHGFRALKRFCTGGAIFPLLIGMYYLGTGSLSAAIHDLVLLNLSWKESFSPAMYGIQFWSCSGVLILSGILGSLSGGDPLARRASRILLLAGLAAVCMVPIPFRQTFLMLFPGLALGAALCWQQLASALNGKKWKRIGGFCLCLLSLLPSISNLYAELQTGPGRDLTLMRDLDARGTEPVFDGRCLLFYRPQAGRYPWMHQGLLMMLDPDTFTRETVSALVDAGYPDVLWDYRVDMMPPALHNFLHRNYVPLSPEPLWVPGVRIDRSLLRAGTEITLPVEGDYIVNWQGGSVMINGTAAVPGQRLHLTPDPLQIRAGGFIRDFTLHRAGATE